MPAPNFLFNHEQLEAMLGVPNTSKVLISLASIPSLETGKPETYLFAQAADAAGIINEHARPVIACPDPPGWKEKEDIHFVSHDQLRSSQKFEITVETLKPQLATNAFVPPFPNTRKQVSVSFDSEIVGGNLVLFVPFIMKDASGAPVGVPVRATAV